MVLAAAGLAWVGFVVHNVADLPRESWFGPETLAPTLVSLTCAVAYATAAPLGRPLLLGWTALNLVGGVLSVAPLPVLPFAPEQSLRHYAFHAVYAATQLPLLWLLTCGRRPTPD